MVFRVRSDLDLKSWGRGKLAVNVTEKASPLRDIRSIIVAYTPQEITDMPQTSAQTSGIIDMVLLRRAQMLQ
jgi:hypothetical protein